MKILIEKDLGQAILDYLVTKPFNEVFKMVEALQKAQIIQDAPGVEAPKMEEVKAPEAAKE